MSQTPAEPDPQEAAADASRVWPPAPVRPPSPGVPPTWIPPASPDSQGTVIPGTSPQAPSQPRTAPPAWGQRPSAWEPAGSLPQAARTVDDPKEALRALADQAPATRRATWISQEAAAPVSQQAVAEPSSAAGAQQPAGSGRITAEIPRVNGLGTEPGLADRAFDNLPTNDPVMPPSWQPQPTRTVTAVPRPVVRDLGSIQPDPRDRPASSAATATKRGKKNTGPRRARLVLRRVDPWSVLKFSLAFSICGVIVGVLAVAILYQILNGLGVFDSVAKFIDTVTDAQNGSTSRQDFRGSLIIGGAAVLMGVGALLFTALATLGAFVYNLCASLTGGLEVTLAERG